MSLTKDEFRKKLAMMPENQPTEEEKAIMAQVAQEKAAGNFQTVPYTPPADRKWRSGVMTLRLPPSLHAELAQLSQKENMSLNQYIVYGLARFAESQSHPQ